MAIGGWWFGFPVYWTLWLLPVMLLSALSMRGGHFGWGAREERARGRHV